VALIFLNRLAKAGVIRGTVRSRWKLMAYFCQTAAILFSVVIVVSRENQTDRRYLLFGILGVVGLLAGAASRTQLYLAATASRMNEGRFSSTSLSVQRNLVEFIKSFCFWLFICLTCTACMALFHGKANSETPAVVSHLFHLGSALALNQAGVVESD